MRPEVGVQDVVICGLRARECLVQEPALPDRAMLWLTRAGSIWYVTVPMCRAE